MTALVWFRDDLRLHDHAALTAAARHGAVVALYVLDEVSPGARPLGGAARWWLHESLARLRSALAEHGVPLVLRRGAAADVVPEVAARAQATAVFWNRRYGPERAIDAQLKVRFAESGVDCRSFQGGLLWEPMTISTQTGSPYRVYSPFWRACLAHRAPEAPLPIPDGLSGSASPQPSDELDDWQLQPSAPNWATGLAERWVPGERAALERLDAFLGSDLDRYESARDRPAMGSTSELSPHLRWGEVSPRTVWHAAIGASDSAGMFLSELGWREFAWHTTFHFGALHERGLDRRFDVFPWREPSDDQRADLDAWRAGRTGFGLVDAGMRELWHSGFMHNRVRMVTASLLTKNLLTDWRIGEAWFWDTLVDADAASNPFNWQWVAGCGADAAPYFRIFNPVTQQQKFDAAGVYVSEWAPDSLLTPEIVDLRASRIRALAAYDVVKHAAAEG